MKRLKVIHQILGFHSSLGLSLRFKVQDSICRTQGKPSILKQPKLLLCPLLILIGITFFLHPAMGLAQPWDVFPRTAYFFPFPMLSSPFFTQRYRFPSSPAPLPILMFPQSIKRRAMATTVIIPTLPSAGLIAPSPTALLAALLFSPLPATTTITNTATFPGTIPTAVVPNNVSATTIQNYNYATTVTTTPILPGLTSLFLPLLI